MPVPDFQSALAEFNTKFITLTSTDESLAEACNAAHQAIAATGALLTSRTRGALAALAASIAIPLEEYVHEALPIVVRGPVDNFWDQIPATVQQLLQECWPVEGGKTFAGKIGVAVVSEGFSS